MKSGTSSPSYLERRDCCRIDDEVLLNFRRLTATDAEGAGRSASVQQDVSSETFTVFSGIAQQRERVRSLMREIRLESPKISRYIAALEERMQFLESTVLLTQVGAFSEWRQWVTLSAGGISFRTGYQISPETVLRLEIVLLPTLVGIASRGRVLRSVRQLGREGDPPYLTATEFIDMKESTRDLIARHVLARQGCRARR